MNRERAIRSSLHDVEFKSNVIIIYNARYYNLLNL